MSTLPINIPDVALIIEGGGMRASYTAGAIVTLLEHELFFGSVYGVSAGSSHAVNYVSRDIPRTKASFVDLVNDPEFGGVGSMLRGHGFFNAPYLYGGLAERLEGTDEVFAFDWDTFVANQAEVHIEGFDADTGETVAWTKADMPTLRALMLRVRASSTMPIFMPPTEIDGRIYMDGGMGTNRGIALDAARRDGFERFFIVRTQERGYRKKAMGKAVQALFRTLFRKQPEVAESSIERWHHYNDLLDEIEGLEAQGSALVFYPEEMSLSNKETDFKKLQAAYDAGYSQATREVDAWKSWLFT